MTNLTSGNQETGSTTCWPSAICSPVALRVALPLRVPAMPSGQATCAYLRLRSPCSPLLGGCSFVVLLTARVPAYAVAADTTQQYRTRRAPTVIRIHGKKVGLCHLFAPTTNTGCTLHVPHSARILTALFVCCEFANPATSGIKS